MSADPQKAKAIFLQAVENHAPDQWPALLDRICADEPQLRHRVESLLDAHQEAATAAHQASETSGWRENSSPEQPGTSIGHYKLLEPIGEGGMGTVWMAQQSEPIKRLVAIKLIKPGMDSKQVLARFDAERQALALMDHPNIAKVFDAGSTGSTESEPEASATERARTVAYASGSDSVGRPYFVMELVKGVPITKYCDEHHLTPRQRLELFIPVCQAIQHAHQKGIIHRDIKPSNVLVAMYDDRPVPKVIDFGVAKATGVQLTEATLHTGFGAVVGTIEYMSPEQASFDQLDVDTRSDIYSLGVLLYELLAGSPPFTKKDLEKVGMMEMLRVIREQEPSKPSTKLSSSDALPSLSANRGTEPSRLTRLVRGELDWIVMKALEKDRNRRYETANGFAADVQRYLNDDAVQACPPSTWYRMRKFVRRNKGTVVATSLVGIALLGGIVGTTAGLIRAEQQRQVAQTNERKAMEAAASEHKAKVAAETSDAETRAVLDFVEEKILSAMRQVEHGGLGKNATLRQAISEALPFVEHSFRQQPLTEARLRRTLGHSFQLLGEGKTACEQFQIAHALYVKHLGADARVTLACQGNIADAYSMLGRHTEAIKLLEETLALQKVTLGPLDSSMLAKMQLLASEYSGQGRHMESLQLREETLPLHKAAFGPYGVETLMLMNHLADNYAKLGRPQDAHNLLSEIFSLHEANAGPDHSHTLASMDNLARSYWELDQRAEALRLLERRLALQKAKLGPEHSDTLDCMLGLACSYSANGQHAEALGIREEILSLSEQRLAQQKTELGPDHPKTLKTMQSLATSYAALDRPLDAIKVSEERLILQKARFGWQHENTIKNMSELLSFYRTANRPTEAIKLMEELTAVFKGKYGAKDSKTVVSMLNLARMYSVAGRHPEAMRLAEDVLTLVKAGDDTDHLMLTAMDHLADFYVAAGRRPEALKILEERLAIGKARLGPDHAEVLRSMHSLADSYFRAARRDEGMKLLEEKLAIQKAKLGANHADTLQSASSLASCYATIGRFAAAAKLNRETLAIRQDKLGRDHADTLSSMSSLAFDLVHLKRGEEALPLIDECLKHAGRKDIKKEMIPRVIYLRLRHFAQVQDAAGCRATAEMWEKFDRTDAESLYQAASLRAVTAAVLRVKDAHAAQREQDAIAEADRAMIWLRQAVAAGYKNAATMKRDRDLEALRSRDDFKSLIAELEAKQGKVKK